MADYDRKAVGPRGGYNNSRKRRYRGTSPQPVHTNLLEAKLCTQTMRNTTADRSAEDMRSPCISKYGSSYLGLLNLYAHYYYQFYSGLPS